MAVVILIAFLSLPLVEITLFIMVGDALGLAATMGLIILTTLAGAWLLRYLGFTAFQRLQEGLARQEYPEVELFNAVCLFAAAVLLIVPGFFTDGLGLLLFLPGLRNVLSHVIFNRLVSSGVVFVHGETPFSHREKGAFGEDGVIEGEFEDLTPKKAAEKTADRKETPPSLVDDHERSDGKKEDAPGGNGTPSSS